MGSIKQILEYILKHNMAMQSYNIVTVRVESLKYKLKRKT